MLIWLKFSRAPKQMAIDLYYLIAWPIVLNEFTFWTHIRQQRAHKGATKAGADHFLFTAAEGESPTINMCWPYSI